MPWQSLISDLTSLLVCQCGTVTLNVVCDWHRQLQLIVKDQLAIIISYNAPTPLINTNKTTTIIIIIITPHINSIK